MLSLAAFPLAAFASTGNIYINPPTLTLPINSALNQHYPAGSSVNLYFGGVSFSGGQFILYLSTNGFSDIVTRNNQPDIPYSATFDVVNLTDTVATHVYTLPSGLTWTIGSGWVNGSLPTAIPGGSYFIKAFDGSQTSVAVTDTSLIVDPGVTVNPTQGNAGLAITFSGSAFTIGSLLNLSYNIGAGAPVYFQNFTTVGSIGNFSVTIPAPDAMQNTLAGANPIVSTAINFGAAFVNGTAVSVVETTVDFTEFARGLVQMRVTGTGGAQQNAPAGQVFGNNTVATLTGVGVTKVLRFAGNYFYPGALTTKWDNAAIANTSPTINGTGWFNTTLTVPPASNGLHNITFTDGNNVNFVIFVTVVPSLILNPTSGPVGTVVTATGYGFTASTTGNSVNASIAWPGVTAYRGSAITDAAGSFVVNFTVPNSVGGVNTISALENATGAFVEIATATFTVTSSFTISPSSFANNASLLVTATGTGFKSGSVYMPNIDNQLFGFNALQGIYQTGISPDATGRITITFVGAGFGVGMHVFSLYENGTSSPAAYAGFNVTGDALSSTDLLSQINQTVTRINSTVTGIDVNVTAIRGTLTSIQGNVATIMTSTGTTIPATLSSIQATLTSIQNSIATIGTPNLGSITSSLSAIDAKITSLQGSTATISTTVGTISTSLESIGAKVTSIETAVGGIATIDTDLGTLTGTVTSMSGNIATIQTSLGTIQTDIAGLQTDVNAVQADVASSKSASESLSPLIIVAIVLALVAAIAAIASIVMMRRKIAG